MANRSWLPRVALPLNHVRRRGWEWIDPPYDRVPRPAQLSSPVTLAVSTWTNRSHRPISPLATSGLQCPVPPTRFDGRRRWAPRDDPERHRMTSTGGPPDGPPPMYSNSAPRSSSSVSNASPTRGGQGRRQARSLVAFERSRAARRWCSARSSPTARPSPSPPTGTTQARTVQPDPVHESLRCRSARVPSTETPIDSSRRSASSRLYLDASPRSASSVGTL
jgi:hypothetical protein